MTERKRNDRGRYTAEYSDEAFLRAVCEHEPATTTEAAEAVGCVRQNADYRLRKLEDAGKVRSKKVGPSLVWMLIDEVEDRDDPSNVGEE
jgi:predicted transcriptional regulator